MGLDFTKAKKNYLSIKMYDGEVIFVGMPKKAVFEKLVALRDAMETTDISDLDSINEIYELTASILSNNKARKEITAEYVGETFDTDDIGQIYQAYIAFATGNVSSPN